MMLHKYLPFEKNLELISKQKFVSAASWGRERYHTSLQLYASRRPYRNCSLLWYPEKNSFGRSSTIRMGVINTLPFRKPHKFCFIFKVFPSSYLLGVSLLIFLSPLSFNFFLEKIQFTKDKLVVQRLKMVWCWCWGFGKVFSIIFLRSREK